jgi:hypothetical protein
MASTAGFRLLVASLLAAAAGAYLVLGERGGDGPWPAAAEEEGVETLWAENEAAAGNRALLDLCDADPKLGLFLKLRPNGDPGQRVQRVLCPNGPERVLEELQEAPPNPSGRPEFNNFRPTLWSWRNNPRCVFLEVGGKKVLVKGDPNRCF